MRPMRIALASWLAVTSACSSHAAGDDPQPDGPPTGPPTGPPLALGVDPDCNPLSDGNCLTPWPSSIYAYADGRTPSGSRLDLASAAFPANKAKLMLDTTSLVNRDGFSPASQIFTVFAGGVDSARLIAAANAADSVLDASPTVLVDVATGERIPHFAEVDVNAASDPDHQALYIRPLARLRSGATYAVAVRKSLHRQDGGALATPPGFAAILANHRTDHARLERARAGLDDALRALGHAGVPLDDLVVAWDFTVASDEALLADLLGGRDLALQAVGARGANVTWHIDSDAAVGNGSLIRRKITGTFNAPLLLDGFGLGGLARGPDGAVKVAGTFGWPFFALIPACVSADHPAPIVVYGHGFFGGMSEADTDAVKNAAAAACAIFIGTEWVGMRTADIPGALIDVSQLTLLATFGQRVVQGMANFVALTEWARGHLSSQILVDGNHRPLADPARIYYYGASQGAVLGATYLAIDPTIRRGALHIGAAAWSLLFERSTLWPLFSTPLGLSYPSPLDIVIAQAVLQLGYDDVDSAVAGAHLLHDPVPGAPVKQVLLQQAVDDCLVTNLASNFLTRTIELPVLQPAVRTPSFTTDATGTPPSAMTVWDEHLTPLPPTTNAVSLGNNGTHGSLRGRRAVLEQLKRFLLDGVVVNTCGDQRPCDCSTGVCD